MLKALGNATKYIYDKPTASLLEAFSNPNVEAEGQAQGGIFVEITAPEFTSLCPISGQPDFAEIYVKYTPRDLCVESKSFKLYLGSFRMFGEFHEACVNRIANDLCFLLKPYYLKVEGRFAPRGGIKFWPTKEIWMD